MQFTWFSEVTIKYGHIYFKNPNLKNQNDLEKFGSWKTKKYSIVVEVHKETNEKVDHLFVILIS